MVKRKFVVFILSHGRSDRVITLNALKKAGYTGDWFVVIDNEDKTAESYYEQFGRDKVIMFDKLEQSKKFDTADNFDDRRTIVYARNVCFELAKELGYDYFLQLDDDYTGFMYRYEENSKLMSREVKQFDKLCEVFLDFLENTGCTTVAFAQGGDFIGGLGGGVWKQRVKRKAMNSFFFRADEEVRFVGRVNEDVNTYTKLGEQGKLFLTVRDVMLNQLQTQSNSGGMTDIYLDSGTYLKSFYSVIFCPSAVTVQVMGETNKRLHHRVNWEKCVPKILEEKYKK